MKDPNIFYENADLFILFSSWEGLPNVVLDALNYDLQIIVSDAPGGSIELVDNGRFGLITPVGDITSLKDTMLIAKNKPLKICKTDRHKFLKKFDIRVVTSSYEGQF